MGNKFEDARPSGPNHCIFCGRSIEFLGAMNKVCLRCGDHLQTEHGLMVVPAPPKDPDTPEAVDTVETPDTPGTVDTVGTPVEFGVNEGDEFTFGDRKYVVGKALEHSSIEACGLYTEHEDNTCTEWQVPCSILEEVLRLRRELGVDCLTIKLAATDIPTKKEVHIEEVEPVECKDCEHCMKDLVNDRLACGHPDVALQKIGPSVDLWCPIRPKPIPRPYTPPPEDWFEDPKRATLEEVQKWLNVTGQSTTCFVIPGPKVH